MSMSKAFIEGFAMQTIAMSLERKRFRYKKAIVSADTTVSNDGVVTVHIVNPDETQQAFEVRVDVKEIPT